ncbi:lytic murein transglycosylase [Rhodococcus sp. ARC_M6]|uniref:lytic transglycosylase domain-containing protein n=1 Tax=Rhodococcus sp. ARC_M6 TaxID=2928852 RepID=UPI001FB2382C|nr:lytic murein transglycosylase [Rhodococcus sp. ARC_M6]MCJ0904688.1 lytic murein transglycosylase [Rhodococcus sp. ARC_M6]
MGRHNQKTDSHIRRNSVIALTGLIPIGLVTAANSAGAASEIPFFNTSAAQSADAAALATQEPQAQILPIADLAETPVAAPEPAPLAPVQETPPLPASMAEGALGIPSVSVAAYQNAERILAVENPTCNMQWTLMAGIGRVESGHAHDGKDADANGNLFDPVIGLPLNGSLPGQAVIMDTDGGALDGDSVYDRAVGPMQFIPSTWTQYAGDGNGDGISDPQNLFDSALTTGKYLCDGGLNMQDITQAAKAIHRYNNSAAYVANVLAWTAGYSTGIVPAASDLPRIH